MPGNNQLSNYPSPQAIRACVHYVLPYRGEVAAFHPRFPERSTAVCREATGPVDLNAPDIIYTAEDDEAIEKFHRGNSMS
ncbi:uncharacterized protein F5891DRAFT_1036134 [Suillus fuscotomentosus]|uniref:Uncharacterized protein n=1 Tax=Suillus fuscotomentosus TaxID=1912939 RepID=A0AAD4HLR4_9AGAM|nr:uncharacterized protein F5891DRAFT_1036134 [Suillus fuscotomentosus]KAG1900104.1 hypothetical protein F5891DRAFT_1036134 [Suillus fuscotomentosus]